MRNTQNGGIPFLEEIQKATIKEIAKQPEIRFDLWIMKTWKVLPTDPRYLDLTAEQRALLWEDFLLDHPEIAEEINKKNVVYDEEFDKLWESLDKEESPSESADDWEEVDEFEDVEEKFTQFVKERGLEIDYTPRAQELLKKTADEWEEVDE